MYDEADIDLLSLTDAGFEEACFDLLLALGFEGLVWRQGSADRGRDIEGTRIVSNPLVGQYTERWFIECKRYSRGVPPEDLNSKIAWADAERPDHLAILMTSHPTDQGLLWLGQMREQKPYAIHSVDGKALRRLFAIQARLVERYFVAPERRLLLDARRNWLVHNIVPEAETLKRLSEALEYTSLTVDEMAFLLASAKLRNEDVERLIDDSEPFYFDFLVPHIMELANSESEVLPPEYETLHYVAGVSNWEQAYRKYVVAEIDTDPKDQHRLALYCLVYGGDGEGVEMLVEASSDFITQVRYLPENAPAIASESFRGLLGLPSIAEIEGLPGATARLTMKVEKRRRGV